MDKLASATDTLVTRLNKLGMSNDEIIAAARTLKKTAVLESVPALINSLKIPLLMAVAPAGAAGYVWGRSADNTTSEDSAQEVKSRRKSQETLSNLDHLLRARERRLNNAAGLK